VRLLVTGASGYIGSHLIALAQKRGHTITAASRRPNENQSNFWTYYELSARPSPELFSNVDVFIHLAANTTSEERADEELEYVAACALLAEIKGKPIKFIFVSSQTAHPNAPTAYGRIKWKIERKVLSAGGWVIRPGQVYGGIPGGLFGRLLDYVSFMPILPAFLPAPLVQPIHVEDLAEGLLRIAENRSFPPGIVSLGSPTPVSFSLFLAAIAKHRLRKKVIFIPIPAVFISLLAIVAGNRILSIKRLHSLITLRPMVTEDDLNKLDLTLRPLSSGMHPSGNSRRRMLLHEARAIFTYVSKTTPEISLIRRYLQAVDEVYDGQPMPLPRICICFPFMIALFDRRSFSTIPTGEKILQRIDAATLLAEASCSGAIHFLGFGKSANPIIRLLIIVRAVVAELFWRMASAAGSPLLRRYLFREPSK
jgi:NADH dehydrogenase